MKRIALPFIGLLLITTSFGQQKEKYQEAFYMLDGNFKGTTEKMAKYFIHAKKIHDSCWQFDTYHMSGTLISSEQYKDERGRTANGDFAYYKKNGFIDSSGTYKNKFQNGSWFYFNDTGKVISRKDFAMGLISYAKDFSTNTNNADIIYSTLPVAHLKDSFTQFIAEPYFPGGEKKWLNYLNKNFEYPGLALKNKIQGEVIVVFTIDKDGKTTDLKIFKSAEYTLDEEALRLIRESPAWAPSIQNGEKVKSRRYQRIIFKLE